MRAQKEPFLLLSFMGIPIKDNTEGHLKSLSSKLFCRIHFNIHHLCFLYVFPVQYKTHYIILHYNYIMFAFVDF